MSSGTDQLRVVLAGHAATGHLYPLLSLADALRGAGHRASFVTTDDLVPWLRGLGYSAQAAGVTIPAALGHVQARSPELTSSLPPDLAWRLDAELFAEALPRANTPALVEAFDRLGPDLVIFESANLGANLAAALLKIPAVGLGLWAVGHWHVARAELESRLRAVWADQVQSAFPADLLYGAGHLDPAPRSLRSPAADSTHRIPMRQLPWGDPAVEPIQLGPSTPRARIYLTLGTVGWGDAELFREALAGIRSLPVDVLVAVGAHFDPADLGELPPSVRVERFVRQDLVLPRVDVAVHHGGSGTLLGAAGHGVPQLVLPLGADQFQNADALVRSGAGRALPHGSVTAESVRDAVSGLLSDPAHRAAAAGLRDEIDDLPTPAETVPVLVDIATPGMPARA